MKRSVNIFTSTAITLLFSLNSALLAADFDIKERIKDHIIGSINYLVNTQADCDSQLKEGEYICNRDVPGERRVNGGWDSVITPIFMKAASSVSFLDSNMFVTAHTLYPFWFIDLDDSELFDLDKTKNLAIDSIEAHRRGNGYSFWPEIGPSLGQVNRIGPLNLSTLLLSSQISIADRMNMMTGISVIPGDVKWLDQYLDRDNQEIGMDALFSVPNDNDDTSLALISNYYYNHDLTLQGMDQRDELEKTISLGKNINDYVDNYQTRKNRMVQTDKKYCQEALANTSKEELFLDIEFMKKCTLDDPREFWRFDAYQDTHSYTGAYMTWAYDENSNIYADPEKGVILTGQNSVDCVVVANSLYAISLSGLKNNPTYKTAYQNSCNVISNIILDQNDEIRMGFSGKKNAAQSSPVWQHCGLFYPSHMLFPYMISRAVRDGGACQDLPIQLEQNRFNKSMALLMKELTSEQDKTNQFKKAGEWYESIDNTVALPTALGAATLLNLGQTVAKDAGINPEELESRIESALNSTLLRRKSSTINKLPSYSLPEGTFFGGGTLNEISLWKSAPFATSVSLEASTKYLMNFDKIKYRNNRALQRNKLIISNIATTNNGITFKSHSYSIDENKFKNKHLKNYLQNTQAIDSTNQQLARSTKSQTDLLAPPTIKKVSVSVETGASHKNQNNFGVVGIELSTGKIFKEQGTTVAYYLVKLEASAEKNLQPHMSNYQINARFLGISTDSDFIKDEVGFLPIEYIKDNDLQEFNIHSIMATIQAPIISTGPKSRICLHAIGKILGYTNKESADRNIYQNTISLADVEIGLVFQYNKMLSFQVDTGTNFGFSFDNISGLKKNHITAPYRLGASAKLNFLKSYYVTVGHQFRVDPQIKQKEHIFKVGVGKKF